MTERKRSQNSKEPLPLSSQPNGYSIYENALVCDDLLYIKIIPASEELEGVCEKGHPFPGARLHYLVDEGQLSTLQNLPGILTAVANATPVKKKKPANKSRSSAPRLRRKI